MFLSQRRDHTYIIRYRDFSGRMTTKSTGTKDKRQAYAFLHSFSLPRGNGTVAQLYSRYLEFSRIEHRPTTVTRIRYVGGRFLPLFGHLALADVTPETLESYKERRSRKVKRTSINIELRHLRAMFEKAVDWGLIERNPMTRVKQLRLPKAEPTYLSLEEFQRLWKALPSQWHRDIVTLAMLTGLRREEFIELTWSDVNLRERVLRVSHGKGDRERFVPINEECVRVLQSIPRTGARPFPYKRNTVSQMFRSARIRAGMNPGLHFHSLRHSFATLTLKNGAAVQDVQKIMGHASITTTMGYTHLVSRDMHDAVAKLPNLKIGTGGS